MRKVKNNLNSTNPAVMFARGVESMIADSTYQPGQMDEHEINQMRRVNKQDSRGNLFSALFRQFANY